MLIMDNGFNRFNLVFMDLTSLIIWYILSCWMVFLTDKSINLLYSFYSDIFVLNWSKFEHKTVAELY